MNQEFVNKLIEAKRMEGEAFRLLLPENVRGHVEIIEKELKAIVLESLAECTKSGKNRDVNGKNESTKVNKVEII